MTAPAARAAPRALPFVLFLAGFSFLVFEVAWTRQLSLVLGATVVATTLVLAAFMAGFGSGAWVWGRVVDRSERPGRLLALLLGGTGLVGLACTLAMRTAIPGLYVSVANDAATASDGPAFVLAALLVFAPTFLMGGVFPLVSRMGSRGAGSLAATLGGLYAVETLGSTLGGLAAGFVLLGFMGQQATVWVAVAIDLAAAIWVLTTMSGAVPAAETDAAGGPESDGDGGDPRATRRAALVATFICGLAMLGLQVLWLRAFRIYFTNTSYTFALVASLAVLGLFVGSAIYGRRGPRLTDPIRSLLRAILLLGILAAAGLFLLMRLPEILMFPLGSLFREPLARILLLPLLASLLVVVPPAVCSGYAFPLACRLACAGRGTVGGDVGRVLAVNTAGSVLGPLLAAFVLLPTLGVAVSVLVVIALLAAVGLYLHRQRPTASRPLQLALAAVGLTVVVTAALRPEVRILPPSFTRQDRQVLFHRESVEGTLTVGRDAGRNASLYTFVNNSAVIGSSYDAIKVVKMVGHFPFLLGLECTDVLVIGFGIGVTTSAIASYAEVESIDCVELVPGLREAAHFYADLNRNVADDPRLRLIGGDGRHWLQRTAKKYDLISCDPTHPILGSGNLYTADYFRQVRGHLKPGGMVSQYLPLHKLRPEELGGLIATFGSVFEHSTVWLGQYHAVLLGSMRPLEVEFADWSARIDALISDERFYTEPHHLAATLMLGGTEIAALATDHPLNTDDRSYTEFFDPECLDEGNISRNLRFLAERRCKVGAVFGGVEDADLMARFVRGNQLMTESLYYLHGGDRRRGLETLRRACEANPEDGEFGFLIELYYGTRGGR